MNRNLSGFGAKYKSFYTYEISYIEELFKYCIIEFLVFTGTKIITCDIYLNSPL